MKNFKKFMSRALASDALKEIKGGMALGCHPVTPQCAAIYQSCAAVCYTGDIIDWYDCIASKPGSGTCSPLVGWDNVCYYTGC